MSIVMLKKLGAKQILGDVKGVAKSLAKEGDKCQAYSIYGTANGIKTGVSTYGDWTAFTGQMEAVNHITGEAFQAVQCFIPEPLQSLLKCALEQNDAIEFAFTVEVVRRDELKEGYEYNVVPHKQVSEADPLEKVRALIPSYPKGLPGATDPKPEKAAAKK